MSAGFAVVKGIRGVGTMTEALPRLAAATNHPLRVDWHTPTGAGRQKTMLVRSGEKGETWDLGCCHNPFGPCIHCLRYRRAGGRPQHADGTGGRRPPLLIRIIAQNTR